MVIIENATIYSPEERLENRSIVIQDGRIQQILPANQVRTPDKAEIIDAKELIVVPGFIDLQLNGAFGADFTSNPDTIWSISTKLPRFGVTAFLPTIITSPPHVIKHAQQVIQENRPPQFIGAEPLGLHLEGPFLNPLKKGAHNPNYLLSPDRSLVRDWSPQKEVRLVTLAPELPGADEVIKILTAQGVVVSAGHSLATYALANESFQNGVRYGTHLFNAMPNLGHREPGLPAALLENPQNTVGLIVDGIHVHPAMVKLVWSMNGRARINLVSDAIAALGMPPGKYILNDLEVVVTETESRLTDGTLAGAILSMDQALRNLISYTGTSLSAALISITTTPAEVLGIALERGRIAPGYIADLVVLTPELEVVKTLTAGKIAFEQ